MEKEAKYLLHIEQNGNDGYIPAVKRGNKWLNLISMEEIEYVSVLKEEKYSYLHISFWAKASGDL